MRRSCKIAALLVTLGVLLPLSFWRSHVPELTRNGVGLGTYNLETNIHIRPAGLTLEKIEQAQKERGQKEASLSSL